MKNFVIYFSFILVIGAIFTSCNDESISEIKEATTEAERVYLSQKSEIQKMNRYYLAGLNIYIQQNAYKDFDISKKRKLWIEKMKESKKIKSLTDVQVMVLDDIILKLSNLNFELNSKESNDFLEYLKLNLEKENFDPMLSQKIFSTLAPIDIHGEVINYNYTNQVATTETLKELNITNKGGTLPIVIEGGGCNSGACFWCSPAYDDCTSSCVESDGIGCGFLLLEHCDVLCYNSN